MERHLKEIIAFDTHFTKFFPTLDVLKKLIVCFQKNHLFFQKRPKIWMFSEIKLFQSYSTENLLKFGINKFSRSETWTFWPTSFSVNAIGKHQVKKRTHLRGKFCFHILNMAQNNINLCSTVTRRCLNNFTQLSRPLYLFAPYDTFFQISFVNFSTMDYF